MRLSYDHYSQSSYERTKRDDTIAFLGRSRYARAFEPGCGYGHLSEPLCVRCDTLLSWECDETTCAQAIDMLAPHSNIKVEHASVPALWPTGTFDLIVLCEFLYYLTPPELEHVALLAATSLRESGELLACHWRHPIPETKLLGDDVHRALAASPELTCVRDYRGADHVLNLWRRTASSPTE
jgi:SAM-dependent methyltransferase